MMTDALPDSKHFFAPEERKNVAQGASPGNSGPAYRY
jgi:hypothetical protein